MFFRYFAPLLVSIFLLFPSQNLYSQTLEEKIGQMLMVSLTSLETSKDTLLIDIQTRNIGGVLFFQNTLQNPTQIANLMSELQDAATVGLFLATDQEGGNVARLNANNGYSTTTSAEFAGSVLESVPTTRSQAATMAGWLADAGINVNLAPVVDVNVNPNSPAIGRLNRSYSDNPAVVAEHAIAFMDEHSSRNIITSTKHFPGHGSALADSHFGFTNITNTWEERELDAYELILDEMQPDMIMTGHLYHRDFDEDHPVSISHKAVNGMLRNELGYDGVVISDELFMQAISDNYTLDEALILTVNSGTDILLFNTNLCGSRCGSEENISLARYAIQRIARAVDEGDISQSRIDESYERIMSLKQKRMIPTSIERPDTDMPLAIELEQNYPNPFNPTTTIRWQQSEADRVYLAVYDLMGRRVEVLVDESRAAGMHQVRFQADARLASGVYLYRLQANGTSITRKMSLVK